MTGLSLRRIATLAQGREPFVLVTAIAVAPGGPCVAGQKAALYRAVLEGSFGSPIVDKSVAGFAGTAQDSNGVVEARFRFDGEQLAPRRRIHERNVAPETIEFTFEAMRPPEHLVIVGAGHIAVPLCALAVTVGYEVTVIDDRSRFATTDRFPGAASIVVREFATAMRELAITPWTSIVLVTRGHEHDERCLETVARSSARYIGMIGSRRRVHVVFDRLRALGVPSDALDRIHAPIGLDLGGRLPEEIALAILAEIVSVRRGGRILSMRVPSNSSVSA